MGSSQDSLGSWDERLQLATAMSEVTEADSSVLHEVHERMLDSQREEVQRRREGLAVSEAAAAVSPATILASKKRPFELAPAAGREGESDGSDDALDKEIMDLVGGPARYQVLMARQMAKSDGGPASALQVAGGPGGARASVAAGGVVPSTDAEVVRGRGGAAAAAAAAADGGAGVGGSEPAVPDGGADGGTSGVPQVAQPAPRVADASTQNLSVELNEAAVGGAAGGIGYRPGVFLQD